MDRHADMYAAVEATINRLSARVYVGLRDGPLDAGDVVALACELLDWGGGGEAVREVVERDPSRVPAAEMAVLARGVLEEIGFEPGFDLEPGRLETLRRALRVVTRDLRTRGIEGEPEVVVEESTYPEAAVVRLASGRLLGNDGTLPPSSGEDMAGAVAAVAEMVHAGLLEETWTVWPQCAEHRLGAHAAERAERAVWWCGGGDGHVLAEVGGLGRA
ncbi:hypothetical protein GCM10010232_03940 [Streptomyces amakusaensis]|uniref:Uncharacterized protein n=1 Tax=Streptomyces amakusaensis TaxID=67271 RepID=A0ABW0AJM2_9ACTN